VFLVLSKYSFIRDFRVVEINKELMFMSRIWGNFVSMHRKKEGGRIFNP
jgi:hypothetical protein